MSDDAIRTLVHQLEVLSAEVRAVRAEVATSNVNMARLETEVRLRACPSPGACVPLTAKVDALEKRVQPLEKLVERLSGMRTMLVLGVSVASGVGAFSGWVLQMYLSAKGLK